jgi:hypothetical protein
VSPSRKELRRLGEQTRGLLDDLESGRQDLLSVPDLNRALRQLLRNQAAILEVLTSAGLGAGPEPTAKPDETATAERSSPRITLREKVGEKREEPQAPRHDLKPLEIVEELEERVERDPAQTESQAPEEVDAGGQEVGVPSRSKTVEVLKEEREVTGAVARTFVEEFDNRDKDYDKGLAKLNRWVAGRGGTPFQWRGDRAYLNAYVGGPNALRNYEEQLRERLGFGRRLGRLVVPGLDGEIVVYERT